jgi:hypothetical protein
VARGSLSASGCARSSRELSHCALFVLVVWPVDLIRASLRSNKARCDADMVAILLEDVPEQRSSEECTWPDFFAGRLYGFLQPYRGLLSAVEDARAHLAALFDAVHLNERALLVP